MKRILCIIMLLAVVLSGCALNKEDVKLASEKQMLRYCERTFGPCEIISFEASDDRITYQVRDEEKGFTYEAESYVSTIWLDTVWGYTERKASDFGSVYLDLFIEERADELEEIARMHRVFFDFETYVWFCEVIGEDADMCAAAAAMLLEVEQAFDTRDFWVDASVHLKAGGESAGHVSESEGRMTPEDEKIDWLMEMASVDMRVARSELVFVEMRTVPCTEVPGYDPTMLVHVLGSDNATKTETDAAWFEHDGSVYVISDLIVMDDHGHTLHLGDFPVHCGAW